MGRNLLIFLIGLMAINTIVLDAYFLSSILSSARQNIAEDESKIEEGRTNKNPSRSSGTGSLLDNFGQTVNKIFSNGNLKPSAEILLNQENKIASSTTVENFSAKTKSIAKQKDKISKLEVNKQDEYQNEVKNKKEDVKINIEKDCKFNNPSTLSRSGIILNEVAWMGGANSANDEWVELKNISNSEINLDGWQLISKDEKIKIIFSSDDKIPAGKYFLLERTDDNSVPSIAANKIYTGSIGNSDDGLRLFNKNCQVIDEVLANTSANRINWPAGDNTSKKTMERDVNGIGWHTSESQGGTPKRENSVLPLPISLSNPNTTQAATVNNPSSQNQQNNTSNDTQSSVVSNPIKILINEIKVSGMDANDEFIELYNPNNSEINLTGWYLQRKTTDAISFSTYAGTDLFSGKKISAKGYLLITNVKAFFSTGADILTDYSITNNNTFVLKNQSGDVVDKVGYGLAGDYELATALDPPAGKSIQRKFSGVTFLDTDNNANDFELQVCPSMGARFVDCQAQGAFFDTQNSTTTIISTSTTVVTPTSAIISIPSPAKADHLVISEIQTTGGPGKTTDDFIELYNPTANQINLKDYRLVKRSESATVDTSIKSWTNDEFIKPFGFYLWANSDYLDIAVQPDATTTATIASNNGIALRFGPNDVGTIIDSVTWGSAKNIFVQGTAFSSNPDVNQSIERKAFSSGQCVVAQGNGELLGNACDVRNNSFDFDLRLIANPQNSSSPVEGVQSGMVILGITTQSGKLNYFYTQ